MEVSPFGDREQRPSTADNHSWGTTGPSAEAVLKVLQDLRCPNAVAEPREQIFSVGSKKRFAGGRNVDTGHLNDDSSSQWTQILNANPS